jgi:hypothetical protein
MYQNRTFFKVEESIFVSKTHWATRDVVNFCSAGVVTQDHRVGSCFGTVLLYSITVLFMTASAHRSGIPSA